MTAPEVTVVVVTYRGRAFVGDCLLSVAALCTPHRLLVIDNASDDGTAELLRHEFPHVDVLRQHTNLGFAGAVAVALGIVDTRWFALLNDDAVADPEWLDALLRTVRERPRVAAVTSRMLLTEADGSAPHRVNNLGVALDRHGYGYDIGLNTPAADAFDVTTPVFGFSGGAALIDVAALRAVGGSPADHFLYYEDVDMSWRLRLAGYEIVSAPDAVVTHRHSATVGQTSALFHRYNERNRLVTLLRCAPALTAVREVLRFGLTTASIAVTRLRGRTVTPAANFEVSLRLGVLAAVTRRLPAAVRARRRIGRRSTVSRRALASHWLGVDPSAAPRGHAAHGV